MTQIYQKNSSIYISAQKLNCVPTLKNLLSICYVGELLRNKLGKTDEKRRIIPTFVMQILNMMEQLKCHSFWFMRRINTIMLGLSASLLVACTVIKEQDQEIQQCPQNINEDPTVISTMNNPDSLAIRGRMQSNPDIIVLQQITLIDKKPVLLLTEEEAKEIGIPLDIYKKYEKMNKR